MTSRGSKYYNEFVERFKTYSNEEIIDCFNKEVGNSGWGTARASYLAAIQNEFGRRKFDYSDIGDKKSLSFKYEIYLEKDKIFLY